MRKEFSDAIEKLADKRDDIVFITGDLGFSALENLQAKLGDRFINAGVAEQNMIGMAAGMAYKGYKVFCYSIAPFVVYRCLEQFRNDVCFHNLPVFVVGNGGGYGYGIMGSSHHALEDLAAYSCLPNASCWVPSFANEIDSFVENILESNSPAYLRLGVSKFAPTAISEWEGVKIFQKAENAKGTILCLGPITNNAMFALQNENLADKFDLISVSKLPLSLPSEVFELIKKNENLLVLEEHVSVGGLAQQLAIQLMERGISVKNFVSKRAEGYPDGTYGDQAYHQKQSSLDPESIANVLQNWL